MLILYLFLIVVIIGLIGLGVGWVLLGKKKKVVRLAEALKMTLFLVKMPRYEKKREGEKQDIKAIIEGMEQIFSNFLYLKKPSFAESVFHGQGTPRVALEIASQVGGSDISFYVAVPNYMAGGIEKTIQGVYPQAVIERVREDYTVFEAKGKVAGIQLYLQRPLYFPIQTYKKLESDPISTVTNALSKIAPDEGSAIQIILRPLSFDAKKRGEKILSSIIEEGKNIKVAIRDANRNPVASFVAHTISAFSGAKKKKDQQQKPPELQQQEKSANEENIEAIRAKIRKPILETNIRLLGVGQSQERADEIVSHLENAFSQFLSNFNGFKSARVKKRNLKYFVYQFSFRTFNKGRKVVLNLEELASLYHFPLSHIESPHIKWAKTKEVAPPTTLPDEGLNLIGQAVYRGEAKPVYFASREDRRRHFYIIGQTGVGKSALLREMIRQDMERGEGVGVIDPNGDLIEDTLTNIPKERAEDVILFEPFDLERPCGLNMLEWKTPEGKDFAISEMITIFSKLFPPEVIGPMFEHYMRNAMLALMADKDDPGTLVEIPRIFTDDEFMRSKIRKVRDPLVRGFWLREWAKTTGQTRSDMLGYVVSKVGRFVENSMMRNIIGQAHSGFDLASIMNQKKIFLANLSKGLTGEMNSSLLGLILVSKMQIAAFRRAELPQEQRQDFYLYVDEFQNFTTNSIAVILSEARKYRLNLILAHQFMPQLTEEIRNAVIGNVGNIAAFRVGADDAEFLEKQFEPEFSRFDLLNIDNFYFICKMMLNNNVSSSFKVRSIPPREGDPIIVELVKRLSKLKYGRPKAAVEAEISKRARLGM